MRLFSEVLKDHQAVCEYLDRLCAGEGYDGTRIGKLELFQKLLITLVAHDRAEETALYEAMDSVPELSHLVSGRAEEHSDIEDLLEQIDDLDEMDQQWQQGLCELREEVQRHFMEEESELFARMEEFVDLDLQSACDKYTRLRDEILASASDTNVISFEDTQVSQSEALH